FRFSKGCSRFFVDGHPPDIQAPAAIAGKVEVLAIGGPYRVQICCRTIGDRNRLTSVDRYCRDSLSLSGSAGAAPVGDSFFMRRTTGLQRVAFGDQSPCTTLNIDHPELTLRWSS